MKTTTNTCTNNSIHSSKEDNDSDDEINKIPFSKKKTGDPNSDLKKRSLEKTINLEVIRKCMRYMNRSKRADVLRDHDIDMAIEDYLDDQRKHIFELLDEIETYPAGLQK